MTKQEAIIKINQNLKTLSNFIRTSELIIYMNDDRVVRLLEENRKLKDYIKQLDELENFGL